MAFNKNTFLFSGDAPGQAFELNYFEIGPDQASQKVYMQAALHADEQPGILVLHHLLPLLKKAAAEDKLNARFIIFPMVNPIGMADIEFRQHQGRYHRASGVNFNRNWPDLFAGIRNEISTRLGNKAQENIRQVRNAVSTFIAEIQPVTVLEKLRKFVMQHAFDADYVFDLHCDNDALMHIFAAPQSSGSAEKLASFIGASAVLTAEDSGGGSFDEVWSALWTHLAQAFPNHPFGMPVFSATLEYRGRFDTFDSTAVDDANRLFDYFQSEGLVAGGADSDTPDSEPNTTVRATALAATDLVRATQAGLLAYCVELGEQVKKGQKIADLVHLDGKGAFTQRTAIRSGTDGIVISRAVEKYVWPGCSVAKIAGKEPLASRGNYLLED